MAFIETRKGKNGDSYAIRFVFRGRARRVSLDSAYSYADAEAAANAVEGFLRADRLHEPLDRKTRVYFETAPPDLLKRFSALGFCVARSNQTVEACWQDFTRAEENRVKDSTALHRLTVFNRFLAFFPPDVRFVDLTDEYVQEFRAELERRYAPTTVNKSVADLRTFGKWAVERGYADANPFLQIRRGPTGNRTRDFQVPAEWTSRILDACPSQNWRTLYCLWRHAGLRRQEPLGLTRKSVDFAGRKLLVHSTKTERYGENHGDRTVPIVPILYAELERQFRELPDGEPYLIYANRRKAFDSGFRRILFDAGLEKWPKTFQNLRSSCENDWVRQGIPPHVVANWLGHSVKTQEAYYLRVLPEYFDRVTN